MDEKIKELEASILGEENVNIEENVLDEKKLNEEELEEQLEEDKLDEEELEETAGGKKKAEPSNLLYKATKKPKTTNTLYSGQSREAGNLLYNEEDKGTTLDGIEFNSEPKLC